MAINYDKLMSLTIPDTSHTYGHKDAILYAMSLGLGSDPAELPFVYEKQLAVLPTMGVVLAHPGFWVRDLDTGLDWVRIVHAEQGLVLHRPLPPRADVIGRSRVLEVVDKGPQKGAFVAYERQILERAGGSPLCTITQTMFCRGDGGFGGPPRLLPPPHAIPTREPDAVCDRATQPSTALIYRLNGDWNPLHADPEVAKQAGFDRPILHGLATYGIAGYAVLATLCDRDVTRVASITARFSAPVFPGETLRTEMWRDDTCISFRVRIVERDIIALNNGRMTLRLDNV